MNESLEDSYTLRTKPITTAKKLPEEQQVRDTFQTPRYAVDLLIPFIPKDVTGVWECASGQRKIADTLEQKGYFVVATDIKQSEGVQQHNFITGVDLELKPGQFSIITNPPFSIKEHFVEKCFEYGVPFALLVNADYSQWSINLVQKGCEKLIPNRRIAYITPHIVKRVNEGEGTSYNHYNEIPGKIMKRYSASQFHSMWLTFGFNLGRTETFVDLPLSEMENF